MARKYTPILVFMMIMLLLSACGPSEAEIQEAIFKTQTAQPTATPEPTETLEPTPTIEPTPTLIPIEGIELSEIIFLENELPAGYEPAQIRQETFWYVKENRYQPINQIYQTLEHGGETGGTVEIYLYRTPEEASEVYSGFFAVLPDPSILDYFEDLGEKSFGLNFGFGSIYFLRCNAFVHIDIYEQRDYEEIQDYAKNLDSRLMDLVCKE